MAKKRKKDTAHRVPPLSGVDTAIYLGGIAMIDLSSPPLLQPQYAVPFAGQLAFGKPGCVSQICRNVSNRVGACRERR